VSSATKGQRRTVSLLSQRQALWAKRLTAIRPHISVGLFGHLFRLKFNRLGFACLCEKTVQYGLRHHILHLYFSYGVGRKHWWFCILSSSEYVTNQNRVVDAVWTVYHLAMYVQSNRSTILLYNRVYSRINVLYNVLDLRMVPWGPKHCRAHWFVNKLGYRRVLCICWTAHTLQFNVVHTIPSKQYQVIELTPITALHLSHL
jgi:hypothetical protein